MAPRYALYYAPATDDALWCFGSGVLGYDAATGEEFACVAPALHDAATWRTLTDEPRRYGFHATLKAPFELAAGRSADDLVQALRSFADGHGKVVLDGLRVAALGRFVALVPDGPVDALGRFAFDVVQHFDDFRAPLGPEDRARRLKGGALTERQSALLDRWGYPYVDEQFRFHMTLTGPIADDRREAVLAALVAAYRQTADICPRAIDRIALFEQQTRDARFRIIAAASLA